MRLIDREINLVKRGLVAIFSRPHYLLWAAAFSAVIYLVFFKFTSLPGQSLESWSFSITQSMHIFTVLYSVMLGFIIAVQIFAWRHVGNHILANRKVLATATPGFFSGVVAMACCAPTVIGLAALVGGGTSGLFSTVQTWLTLPAVLLLLLSLHYSLRGMAAPSCN